MMVCLILLVLPVLVLVFVLLAALAENILDRSTGKKTPK